jgi:hydrogenase expression/formation protein HypE
VERGKADKLFLSTSGVGVIPKGIDLSGSHARPGDHILINGSVGDHGLAVLLAREDFKLSAPVKSDCAPLNHLACKMLAADKRIHVLRDPTRGGVATTLNEIAAASGVGIIIEEDRIPVRREVRAACDILGIDPLYAANEGKLLASVPGRSAALVLRVMRRTPYGRDARAIGTVVPSPRGVWLKTSIGGLRPLIMLEGDQLPRIC